MLTLWMWSDVGNVIIVMMIADLCDQTDEQIVDTMIQGDRDLEMCQSVCRCRVHGILFAHSPSPFQVDLVSGENDGHIAGEGIDTQRVEQVEYMTKAGTRVDGVQQEEHVRCNARPGILIWRVALEEYQIAFFATDIDRYGAALVRF